MRHDLQEGARSARCEIDSFMYLVGFEMVVARISASSLATTMLVSPSQVHGLASSDTRAGCGMAGPSGATGDRKELRSPRLYRHGTQKDCRRTRSLNNAVNRNLVVGYEDSELPGKTPSVSNTSTMTDLPPERAFVASGPLAPHASHAFRRRRVRTDRQPFPSDGSPGEQHFHAACYPAHHPDRRHPDRRSPVSLHRVLERRHRLRPPFLRVVARSRRRIYI